jgi:hypothetical protein
MTDKHLNDKKIHSGCTAVVAFLQSEIREDSEGKEYKAVTFCIDFSGFFIPLMLVMPG